VITRRLDLDPTGPLFGPGSARTIVLTSGLAPEQRLAAAGRVADVIVTGQDGVTAAAAVDALADRGHRKILVEGGANWLGQLAAERLLDELCLTISPVIEGGQSAKRVTHNTSRAELTGLRLAALLEDDGFLLSRYVRA
jgi:riboflavin biosynthesis pyrimidine reductase